MDIYNLFNNITMTAIQSKKQIKAELAKINKKLASLGLKMNNETNLFFLKPIPKKNLGYSNKSQPMLAQLFYDSSEMSSCCGIEEFTEVGISNTFNKYDYKNINFELSDEVKVLMYQHFFLTLKYAMTQDTFKRKIRGRSIIYVSNHANFELDEALSSLSREFSKQDLLFNRGSNNLLTVYISKH